MESKQVFNKALSNFINDSASGGAVRHLADLGLTVSEIMDKLDYPLPKSTVADMVWQHYLDKGIILPDEPTDKNYAEIITYVKDVGAYGRTSLRRVVEKVELPLKEYVKCDFGKKLRRGDARFITSLDELEKKDKEYILDLPWPITPVYHVADERMVRIIKYGALIYE